MAGKLHKDDGDSIKADMIKQLEEAGFKVDDSTPDVKGKMEDIKQKYDACLVVMNVVGFAQYNTMRIKWSLPINQPWYVSEFPTVFLSLNFTNHMIDVPMAKTYINAYMNSEAAIHAAIEKLTGKSEFKGRNNDKVFCDRWEARI